MPMGCERKLNFGAGPAKLPLSVLEQFSRDMINFNGSGIGVGELSHRTPLFERDILEEANRNLSELTGFNRKDWSILWMTGGGTGQFAAVPMNFAAGTNEEGTAIYLVTGTWSEKAAEEAKRILGGNRVKVIDLRMEIDGIKGLRPIKDFKEEGAFCGSISYVYYCDNETVDGIELPDADYFQNQLSDFNVPFVVDMSSNFLSRPMSKSERTGIIFAGVQKNLGAAGVTVVLIRNDLLQSGKIKAAAYCPSVFDYRLTAKNNSLLNTPPVLAIHICNLVLKDLLERFGKLEELDSFSRQKCKMIYEAIERSDGEFYCPISREFRSRMNVIFKGKRAETENEFLLEAERAGMIQLKGHRSVGGLRASLYNAVTFNECESLANLISRTTRNTGNV